VAGVIRHGFGNWSAISADSSFGIADAIAAAAQRAAHPPPAAPGAAAGDDAAEEGDDGSEEECGDRGGGREGKLRVAGAPSGKALTRRLKIIAQTLKRLMSKGERIGAQYRATSAAVRHGPAAGAGAPLPLPLAAAAAGPQVLYGVPGGGWMLAGQPPGAAAASAAGLPLVALPQLLQPPFQVVLGPVGTALLAATPGVVKAEVGSSGEGGAARSAGRRAGRAPRAGSARAGTDGDGELSDAGGGATAQSGARQEAAAVAAQQQQQLAALAAGRQLSCVQLANGQQVLVATGASSLLPRRPCWRAAEHLGPAAHKSARRGA
jgi:hypothetical protein